MSGRQRGDVGGITASRGGCVVVVVAAAVVVGDDADADEDNAGTEGTVPTTILTHRSADPDPGEL